jgi:phenylalanyl-tRNA synthetase beta chain
VQLGGDVRDGALTYRPPSWRSDLEREIDLIEEVARIHGYGHIPENCPVPITSTPRGRRERIEDAVRSALTGCGFDEAVTFSLGDDTLALPLEDQAEPTAPIRVEHSSRKRENALRQSLVPSLLAARRHNEAHSNADAELFEIANVYRPRPGKPLPEEPTRLALVSSRDYLGLKGVIEALLERLHVLSGLEVRPAAGVALFDPGKSAELRLGETHLGYLGALDSAALERFELREACTAAELEFSVLETKAELVPEFRPLPPFPAVSRDLSLVVPQTLAWSDLARTVVPAAGPILEALDYLDTFRGGSVPEGQQSLHFGLRFRHPERTLTGEEVEQAVRAIVDACVARLGATLRT